MRILRNILTLCQRPFRRFRGDDISTAKTGGCDKGLGRRRGKSMSRIRSNLSDLLADVAQRPRPENPLDTDPSQPDRSTVFLVGNQGKIQELRITCYEVENR